MGPFKSLAEVGEGRRARIVRILGGRGMRQHLQSLGLHIGTTVVVRRASFWGGPVLVETQGASIALGRGIAAKVWVEEVGEP